MFKFELGIQMKDRITGFAGMVTGRADYITGCNQYVLQPQVKKDGDAIDGRWFDEHRLERVGTDKALVLDNEKQNGACTPAPIK